ncbi:pimeloyl-ACP methyl ester carboxylesterase [Mycoplana sp. BE70]|uniref:alpha/beta fold hydrolase n=1 Tax=Mycoplana sp. BE70 TaxID=2817775 RepID=UPI00285463F2|nr:alpha/beta hydrolase [Mycoplana sp. BE70]MDR6755493.1 pimeloyl-ACP methyl ester carboxylesterase [Mycoplana sp. BE70]
MVFNIRTIVTRHGAVRYSDTGGSGFPILLIHGSSFSRRVFEKQFDSGLAGRWRLIAVDLPGHGDSEDARDPRSAYAVTGFADCLEEIAEALDLKRLAIFGWSLGGHAAIEWMSRSTRIRGLMLCGAPPMPRGLIGMFRAFHPSRDLLLTSKQTFSERDAARFSSLCFGSVKPAPYQDLVLRADGLVRSVFAQSLARGDGADQRRAVETASIPIAIVAGADDPFVKLGYLSGIHLPGHFSDETIVIDGAGHAPFWERPDVFNPILDRFLDTVAADTASAWQAHVRRVTARARG